MKKFWQVFQYEFTSTIRRRSFLIMAFGIPLIALVILLAVNLFKKPAEEVGQGETQGAQELAVEGVVDYSGWIKEIPPDLPEGTLKIFEDESSAEAALLAGEIETYYIIPRDYVRDGEIVIVKLEVNPLEPSGQSWVVGHTLTYNFLGQSMERTEIFWNVLMTEWIPLGAAVKQEMNGDGNPFVVAYPLMMMFYVLILTSSSLLLNSVTNEKKNRVLEILMTTIKPRQMLAGKTAALGVTGLLQTMLWTGTFYVILKVIQPEQLTGSIGFSIGDLLLGLLFFLLGYALYASLMAALGALVADPKEASQSIFIVIAPIIVPLFFYPVLMEQPYSTLAVILSIIPFTAPVAMIARTSIIQVPLWQMLLSAGLLLLTASFVLAAASRMFKANILLSGQKFSVRRYFSALFGRVAVE